MRSEARNHHPCPLCPSARPSRPLWPSVTALGAAHVLFPPCKPGPAHPICTLSVPPLISLPVCKNSSHSPSPFPCLSRRHRGGIGATCPPPANISRLGRILSHGDPKRAPGAEFCASLHGALGVVHACRACCSCLVQKSGPMSVTEPACRSARAAVGACCRRTFVSWCMILHPFPMCIRFKNAWYGWYSPKIDRGAQFFRYEIEFDTGSEMYDSYELTRVCRGPLASL